MSEFVKLTLSDERGVTWYNHNHIRYITVCVNGDSCLSFGESDYEYVTETPEQIMALIDGPADRGALVDELVGALRNCVAQIGYLHDKFQETGSGNQVLAQAFSAINRAVKS